MTTSPATRRQSFWIIVCVLGVVIALIGYGIVVAIKKPKPISATATTIDVAKPTVVPIAWPKYGEAALLVHGTNQLITNSDQTARPIASIAKTILALALLKEKPLAQGQPGPTITFTEADINLYKAELAQNGSVVPIATGEELTEYQALQALLLPSGNNIADSLAVWAFGSMDGYVTYANKFVADLGLTTTHLADPSGFSPDTVSSAHDLVLLGQLILKEPALAEVVAQSDATLPVVGAVQNINSLLGTNDIVGIKTGNTDQAGGCLLFASKGTAANGGATIIGAILGAPDLATVLQDTTKLLATNRANYKSIMVVKAGQVVATYTTPWGGKATAATDHDLVVYSPNGAPVSVSTKLETIPIPAKKGAKVGSVIATIGESTTTLDLTLSASLNAPSLSWRLLHPF